ncbi:hypothetical protein AOB60_24360 [Streptomyces noursei]|uniref:Uncharacterized protein n=1 Tax=Streptomyces noursei TaxID=1971 RepID=A0A2N8P8V3_STRNR|nr:hypothetical protein AOB60_24360 [Streptomyces noursei]
MDARRTGLSRDSTYGFMAERTTTSAGDERPGFAIPLGLAQQFDGAVADRDHFRICAQFRVVEARGPLAKVDVPDIEREGFGDARVPVAQQGPHRSVLSGDVLVVEEPLVLVGRHEGHGSVIARPSPGVARSGVFGFVGVVQHGAGFHVASGFRVAVGCGDAAIPPRLRNSARGGALVFQSRIIERF